MTVALAESVGQEATDPDAQLAANLLLATWTVAFVRAHRTYRDSRSPTKAKSVFLALIERGSHGIEAAMAGTRYAQAAIQETATPSRVQKKQEKNSR